MNTKNLLLGILMVLIFGVGFLVGRFSLVGNSYMTDLPSISAGDNSDADNSDTSAGEGTTINTSSLTDGQKKLLSALGIDADSVTVTPAMIACAEASLGPVRIDEIINGATPSFTEGLKLAGCYK